MGFEALARWRDKDPGEIQPDIFIGMAAEPGMTSKLNRSIIRRALRECAQRLSATPVTTEALRRIAALYVIEAEVRGKPPDERRQARQARSLPLLDDLERWLRTTLDTLSRKSDTAAAIPYALKLWPALLRRRRRRD